MIVKLGWVPLKPLLRTKAVRRQTSPCSGSSDERGDQALALGEVRRAGRGRRRGALADEGRQDREAERPAASRAADHGAEAERRALEELVAREALRLGLDRDVRRPRGLRLDLGRRRGARAPRASPRGPRGRRRRSRSRAPIADDEPGLTISPTSSTTTPTAKPSGQMRRRRDGACRPRRRVARLLVPSLYRAGFNLPPVRTVNDVTLAATRTDYDASRGRAAAADPVLGPAAVDERPHLGAHLDLAPATAARPPPAPCASRRSRACRRTNCERRRVVELVERALGEHDVALRVDVRADVEEHLRVVVDVDVLVDDDDRLREARASRAPRSRASPSARGPGYALRIETITQLWNAPATGRS